MKSFTKDIAFVATLAKWCKVRKLFEGYDPIGDIYLRSITDAEFLAKVWNPSNKSSYKVRLQPCAVFAGSDIISISHLYPIRFYADEVLVGKLFVNVKATAEKLTSLWKGKNKRVEHPWNS